MKKEKYIPANEIPVEVAEDPRSMAAFALCHVIMEPNTSHEIVLPPHVAAIDAQLAKRFPTESWTAKKQ